MEGLFNLAIFAGKVWLLWEIIGMAFAVIVTIVVLIFIISAFRGR